MSRAESRGPMRAVLAFAAACLLQVSTGIVQCPGSINLLGHGNVSMIAAKVNVPGQPGGAMEVRSGGQIVPHMTARAYFADSCTSGSYDNTQYVALKLLRKTMRYTVDLSGAGCGCNVAFYLTSLHQNSDKSNCNDYYCDANNVCGVSCAEIDIQEANMRSWHSTLHSATDHGGEGKGYGGGSGWNGPRDFGSAQYGPGARCVDTSKPFDVEVSFPVNAAGSLAAMEVKMSQKGHSCPISLRIDSYAGMAQLSDALEAGMTPIVSYWKSGDMLWMDGKGADGQGPCATDNPDECSNTVKFYDMAIYDIGGTPPARQPAAVHSTARSEPSISPASPLSSPAPSPLPVSPAPLPVPSPLPVLPAPLPAPPSSGKCAPVRGICAGKGWTGPVCCESGCTCHSVDRFFSVCKPPEGLTQCTLDAMPDMTVIMRKDSARSPIKEATAGHSAYWPPSASLLVQGAFWATAAAAALTAFAVTARKLHSRRWRREGSRPLVIYGDLLEEFPDQESLGERPDVELASA